MVTILSCSPVFAYIFVLVNMYPCNIAELSLTSIRILKKFSLKTAMAALLLWNFRYCFSIMFPEHL